MMQLDLGLEKPYLLNPATGERTALPPESTPALTGRKDDSEKAPLELLSTAAMLGTAQVLAFGANKYAAHNWRGGIEFSRLIGAALRHITAYNDGEDLDPESGLSHIDHAQCCLMFLSEQIKKGTGLDDRYKRES